MKIIDARLYLCTDARSERRDFADFVDAAFSGGVDIIQLRDKSLEAGAELEYLSVLQEAAERHGKLWAVNNRADVAAVSGAPVFHVGQRDLPLPAVRAVLDAANPETRTAVGLSTHSSAQAAEALDHDLLDYFCVGPVWATPTKPGRSAVGLEALRAAAATVRARSLATKPWFAIGGIDLENVGQVVQAGASRIVVVRAITEASDPAEAARRLLDFLPELES